MMMVEQILYWAIGIALLVLVYRLVHKEKFTFAFFAFTASLVCLLCGTSWFQGLMKTKIISVVTVTLKDYGKKLDDFQRTTSDMQREMDEAQSKLRQSQSELATAQTNISVQQAKIENVETLVNNLFSKMTYENIFATDTNRFFKRQLTNGDWQVFVVLKNVPIRQSIQGTVDSGEIEGWFPQIMKQPVPTSRNVVLQRFDKDWPFEKTKFSIQYVKDSRDTNLVREVRFVGDEVFFDERLIRLVAKDPE